MRYHMPCSTGPCHPTKAGSEAATCSVAPDLTFLIGSASAPPRVPQLQTLSSCKGGLRCATCHTALDHASLQGRAPLRHVSYSSRSCLPAREGSGAPRVLQLRILPPCMGGLRCITCPTTPDPASLHERAPVCHMSYNSGSCLPTREGSSVPGILRLQILAPYREGSGVATACPAVSCGIRASNIKKSLDPCVPNARVHISKTPDVRAIMSLRDVRAGSAVNTYKTCGYAATLQR
jgi:polyferredoxin